MRQVQLFIVVLASVLLLGTPAFAFTLDQSLSGSGIDRIPVGDRDSAGAEGVAVMPDGRTVLGGYAKQGDRTLGAVERLTPTGDADPTFAADTSFPGTVLIDATSTDDDEGDPVKSTIVRDVVVAPDGSIYVTGQLVDDAEDFPEVYGQPFAAHILADGSLDPAFVSPTAKPGIAFFNNDGAAGRAGVRLVLGPDGSLFILGESGAQSSPDALSVTKLTPSGKRVPDYGTDGTVRLEERQSRTFYGNDLALDAQGRVVVVGVVLSSAGPQPMLARFTTSGALDTTFGGEPYSPTSGAGFPGIELAGPVGLPDADDPNKQDGFQPSFTPLNGLVIAPDGKIVVAGDGTGAGAALGVVGRFTAQGKRDTSFGTKGYMSFRAQKEPDVRDHNHDTYLQSVVLDGNRIVALGTVNPKDQQATTKAGEPFGVPDLVVAGITSGGKLDASAHSGGPRPGVFTTPVGADRGAVVRDAVLAGGKVSIAGHAASLAPTQFGGGKNIRSRKLPSDFLLVRIGQGTAAPGPDPGPDAGGCVPRVTLGTTVLTACFTKKGDVFTAKEGTVMMNGTRIALLNGTSLVVDRSERTIKTRTAKGERGVARVSVAAPGGAVVALSKGPIDFKVPSGAGSRATKAEFSGNTCKPVGTKLGTVSTQGVGNLLGFPLPGSAAVSTSEGRTFITVNVGLPKPAFLDAGGCATLVTTATGGLQLDSLHVEVGAAALGPLTFGEVAIDYTGSSDTWKGTLVLNLDLPAATRLTGDISFTGGEFAEANINADFTPGFPILPPINLVGVHGGVALKPFPRVSAGVHLAAGPQIFGKSAIDADITGTISFPGKEYAIAIDIRGEVKVVTIPLATADVHYDTGGTLTIKGHAGFNAYVAEVDVDVKGGIQGKHFFVSGALEICVSVVACAKAAGLISEVGAAACFGVTNPIKDVALGFAVRWSESDGQPPDRPGNEADAQGEQKTGITFFANCDLSPYETFKVARLAPAPFPDAFAAQADLERTVTVKPGTKALGVKVGGTTATPLVSVIGPNGERLDGPAAATPGFPLPQDQISRSEVGSIISFGPNKASYVALTNPAPGKWRIVPREGSPPIATFEGSHVLPQPMLDVKVQGKGRRRTLSFGRIAQPGETIRFVERGKGSEHQIGSVASGTRAGSFNFSPGNGRAGKRQIVAHISQNGLPRKSIVVASYVAPRSARPGKAGNVKLRVASRSGVRATWRKAPGAVRYVVKVRLKDGHRTTAVLKANARSARFVAFVPRKGGVVTVTPVNKAGLTGKTSRATLRPKR